MYSKSSSRRLRETWHTDVEVLFDTSAEQVLCYSKKGICCKPADSTCQPPTGQVGWLWPDVRSLLNSLPVPMQNLSVSQHE
jgi:hypothetical protein